jgi:hypothetical protein
MSLLRPSSAFLTTSIVPLVKRLSLANLHPVFPITEKRSITTSPPPSVPRAGMLAPRRRVKRCQSSLLPRKDVIALLSCLLYAGRDVKQSTRTAKNTVAPFMPFGQGVSAISPLYCNDA